jgi:hypothetical protein
VALLVREDGMILAPAEEVRKRRSGEISPRFLDVWQLKDLGKEPCVKGGLSRGKQGL